MSKKKELDRMVNYLKTKSKVLLIATSNRWEKEKEIPKSTLLAMEVKKRLGKKAVLIDSTKLKIYPCEGNVSISAGNNCGVKHALLKDKNKNPSMCHRCWASINHPDDELWKISKELLSSDAVIFFGPVRWGQMNAEYQKLMERLTWLENRHASLGEGNILKNIEAGLVCTGHNWNLWLVKIIQGLVFYFYGFKPKRKLFISWQYTINPYKESIESYKYAKKAFLKDFGLNDDKI
jgi:multimeric flavodoxin WrbA